MTLRVDFASLKYVTLHPRSLLVTIICNWAFQPFLMWGLALLFFRVFYQRVLDAETQKQYVAGALILGGRYALTHRCCFDYTLLMCLPWSHSPCTAMVFVWSQLVHGHAAFTLLQVAINDLLVLVLYVSRVVVCRGRDEPLLRQVPTLYLLLDLSEVHIPYVTIIVSVSVCADSFTANAHLLDAV
jgi:ACR3 family arsenite transporter